MVVSHYSRCYRNSAKFGRVCVSGRLTRFARVRAKFAGIGK
ncbi:hypothetical protein [Paraburkholderia elongata]